jgi:recombination protein RecA
MASKLKLLKEAELRKKYKTYSVNAGEALANDKSVNLRIPSRLIWNNRQLGGGTPYGKVMEIFGYESTGKTLMALDYAYGCQQLGGVVLFADAERAFDYAWAELNGLDLSRLEVMQYNSLEMFSDWLKDMVLFYRSQLTHNEPILVIYDSIAAAESEDGIGADQSNQKGTYGMNRSKAWNEFYRRRIDFLARYGASLIMLNQVRKKIGATMYESQEQTPGGGAHQFYASIRQSLGGGSSVRGKVNKKTGIWTIDKQEGKTVGKTVYVKAIKNKTAPPAERATTEVYFKPDRYGYVGYNRYNALSDILVDLNILKIKKDGNAKAYYLDGQPIIRKLDTFSDELHTNSKLRKKLITLSGINTISKTREALAEIKTNLYPVKIKADE